MILNFPYLHKDELLYSAIGRYFHYLNEDGNKWILEHMFNVRDVRATIGFPTRLESFSGNLPIGSPYTPNYIIDNHTLYPLFRPFIEKERHQKIINDMFFKDGKGILTKIGIVASSISKKKYLYYCPKCIEEQQNENNLNYLDVFWNRIHQCSGVLVCHNHKVWLNKTPFSLDEIPQHKFISIGSVVEDGLVDMNYIGLEENRINELHVKLAQNIEWLLNNNLPSRDLNYYRHRYIEYLKSKGIARPSGSIDIFRLKKLFLDFYPKEFLEQLESNFNINDEQTWVQMIVQKNRKAFHPNRHILMIILLAGSSEEFFTNEYTHSPFGKGPWDCNNPVCSMQTQLISIGYSYDSRREYGEFICDCGYQERRYVNGKPVVLEYGELWSKKLIEFIESGEGIYKVSEMLGADVNTIKQFAVKNNILYKWTKPRIYNKNSKNLINDERSNINHYKVWNDVIKGNQSVSRTEVRRKIPATYAWLYRNDRDFLKENLPTIQKPKLQTNRVDWGKRDEELLEITKEIVRNWDKDNQKPIRKTKKSIGIKTKRIAWIEKVPQYFPKTLGYLVSEVEDVESFQIRRVRWILDNVNNERQVKEWEIYRKAALRSNVSEKVRLYIKEEVELHNYKVAFENHSTD